MSIAARSAEEPNAEYRRRGFTLKRSLNRRIVRQGNPDVAVQPSQHSRETRSPIVGIAPGVETTSETHRTTDTKTHAVHGEDRAGVVEYKHASVGQHGRDLGRTSSAAQVVMVAQDRDDGQTQITDLAGETGCMRSTSPLSQVTREQQHVRVAMHRKQVGRNRPTRSGVK